MYLSDIFLGIDPGVGGGVVSVTMSGAVSLHKMPETPGDLRDLLASLSALGIRMAMLERVNAGVFGHGKAGTMGVTSAFTFGKGFGRLEATLACVGIPYEEVSPLKWQNAMGCRSGGDKNVTKRRAQALFPGVEKISHATADALLLAEYCRRLHGVNDGDRQPAPRAGSTTAGARQPSR